MTFEVKDLGMQPRYIYHNVKCDSCDKPLRPVNCNKDWKEGDEFGACLQPENTLKIRLSGGYGMAIDP